MSWVPKPRVLVPVDFSDESWGAVDVGLDLVAAPSGLHVLHVLPEFQPSEPVLLLEAYESAVRRKHAESKVRERLSDSKYRDLKIDVVVGDPGTEIANFARQWHVDLIVMPSHGRSGIARLLIGSVAERVTRTAHCPVLILRK